jgi:hypothetical protein
MTIRDLQRHAVDSIKRHALTLSLRSPRAQAHILTEYLWSEEGAESTVLERVTPDAPEWLDKLIKRQLGDEQRHASLLRARLAELGVTKTPPPPQILKVKLWWLDRVCEPYKTAFSAGPIVVLLAAAAQLEATGVRMFSRHLGVLEERAPEDPTTEIVRSIVGDEKRHAKSCKAAALRLVREHERETFDELCEKIASIDRALGITISVGFWMVMASSAVRDRVTPRTQLATEVKVAA